MNAHSFRADGRQCRPLVQNVLAKNAGSNRRRGGVGAQRKTNKALFAQAKCRHAVTEMDGLEPGLLYPVSEVEPLEDVIMLSAIW